MTISTMDYSRKRPGSSRLASSTRRGRANDEMNAHRMLRAITAAVVVVAAITLTQTMLASDIRRSTNERSGRLDGENHCVRPRRARLRLFQASVPDAPADLRKTCRYTASPPRVQLLLRNRRFLTRPLDEMISCTEK